MPQSATRSASMRRRWSELDSSQRSERTAPARAAAAERIPPHAKAIITELVAGWPVFSNEQRAELASLLRP